MKIFLVALYLLAGVFVMTFTVIGWRCFSAGFSDGLGWIANDIVSVGASIAVIVIPFYLNPPKALREAWGMKGMSIDN
jgi:hypothetical protein